MENINLYDIFKKYSYSELKELFKTAQNQRRTGFLYGFGKYCTSKTTIKGNR